jgi:hypothetical protein
MAINEDLDLSELEEIVGPTDDQLKEITALARRQLASERTVASAQDSLDEAKRNLRRINENLLPDAMAEIGMDQFKLTDGTAIDIKETIRASISEANRLAAHQWLREHNHGAIIRRSVTITFDPGEDDVFEKVTEFLDANDIEYDGRNAINHNTLTAWVRNQLREGNTVPEEISHYEQRISKVKV